MADEGVGNAPIRVKDAAEDDAGKIAGDRGELAFGLAEAALDLFPLGDVDGDADEARDPSLLDDRRQAGLPPAPAVGAGQLFLVDERPAAGDTGAIAGGDGGG